MRNPYDERYERPGYYWGRTPSQTCYRVLQLLPPERPLRLLDIGCGEGRNAGFFARNGHQVTAFDMSPKGVEKTKQLAAAAGVPIEAFVAEDGEDGPGSPFLDEPQCYSAEGESDTDPRRTASGRRTGRCGRLGPTNRAIARAAGEPPALHPAGSSRAPQRGREGGIGGLSAKLHDLSIYLPMA
jgi:hypothetical protein